LESTTPIRMSSVRASSTPPSTKASGWILSSSRVHGERPLEGRVYGGREVDALGARRRPAGRIERRLSAEPEQESAVIIDGLAASVHAGAGVASVVAVAGGERAFERKPGSPP
jgi:hypothetical protein